MLITYLTVFQYHPDKIFKNKETYEAIQRRCKFYELKDKMVHSNGQPTGHVFVDPVPIDIHDWEEPAAAAPGFRRGRYDD